VRPELCWRLAENDEESNVNLHGLSDRRPLSIDRFSAEFGINLWLDPTESAQSFLSWKKATPGYWGN
jgi:hypothetical protein